MPEPETPPLDGSVAWWRFVATRFPEYEHCIAQARSRDVQQVTRAFADVAEALRPLFDALADTARRIVEAFHPFAILFVEAVRVLDVTDPCPLCAGTLPDDGRWACPLCDDTGRVPRALTEVTVAPPE